MATVKEDSFAVLCYNFHCFNECIIFIFIKFVLCNVLYQVINIEQVAVSFFHFSLLLSFKAVG